MISIPATGVWLSFQPGDSCLGGVGTICFAFGFLVILFVCCVMCGCNKESPAVLSACCCTVIALFLGIILVSLYALISSTLGFALLEKHIIATESWMDIKHCLYETKNVCYQLERKYADDTPDQFTARHLTLVESGCCKPPTECNFNFSSPTIWIETTNSTYSNADCYKWDNDPKKLCYNCQVCKLGFARDLKKTWNISGSIIVIAWLVIVSVIAYVRPFSRSGCGYNELR
ncbi:hypothetical protein BVRB_6g140670 [Beta vulgaris subsp. vulgaris]|nr:hypothetical protein BVRB_6g140670 [Beta vulgaris subsp. vulgaris]